MPSLDSRGRPMNRKRSISYRNDHATPLLMQHRCIACFVQFGFSVRRILPYIDEGKSIFRLPQAQPSPLRRKILVL
jgi:hypothetical protein